LPREDPIAHRYRLLKPHFTDDELRLWAAAEASVSGPDTTAMLARLTGIPEAEIQRSLKQIKARTNTDPNPKRSSS
jgi:hypothetical protein